MLLKERKRKQMLKVMPQDRILLGARIHRSRHSVMDMKEYSLRVNPTRQPLRWAGEDSIRARGLIATNLIQESTRCNRATPSFYLKYAWTLPYRRTTEPEKEFSANGIRTCHFPIAENQSNSFHHHYGENPADPDI